MSILPENIKAWQVEFAVLTAEHDAEDKKLKGYWEKVRGLDCVHRKVEKALMPDQQEHEK